MYIARAVAGETLISIDLLKNGISPEPRTNPSMAVDSIGKILNLFGGRNQSSFLNDLWSFLIFNPDNMKYGLCNFGTEPLSGVCHL